MSKDLLSDRTTFLRTWFHWNRRPAPIRNFRNGIRRHPGYDLECALDHLVSSVWSLGSGYFAGEPAWDFPALIPPRIAELERVSALVEAAPLDAEQRTVYASYLAATRDVLEALLATATRE